MKIESLNNVQKGVGKSNEKYSEVVETTPAVQSEVAKSQNENKEDVSLENQTIINDEMLEKAIEVANKTLKKHNNFIERSVHEKTKAVMYVLKDQETNEVIKEFPPKKIQDMIAKMWELAGLFVDEKA